MTTTVEPITPLFVDSSLTPFDYKLVTDNFRTLARDPKLFQAIAMAARHYTGEHPLEFHFNRLSDWANCPIMKWNGVGDGLAHIIVTLKDGSLYHILHVKWGSQCHAIAQNGPDSVTMVQYQDLAFDPILVIGNLMDKKDYESHTCGFYRLGQL